MRNIYKSKLKRFWLCSGKRLELYAAGCFAPKTAQIGVHNINKWLSSIFFLCGAKFCGIKPQKKKQHGEGDASPRAVKLLKVDLDRVRGVNGCQSFFFDGSIKQRCTTYKQSAIFTAACPALAVPPTLEEPFRAITPRRRRNRAQKKPGNVPSLEEFTDFLIKLKLGAIGGNLPKTP